MKNYILSPQAMVMVSGSSIGTQPKYYDKNYWYKENQMGYESTSETLSSLVLSCSNAASYVKYEECTINNRRGCRSKSFLKKDESFISFQHLFEMYHGGNLSEHVITMTSVEERIRFTKNFVLEYTGFDCSEYLSKILTFDMLILNTDRHFNNLGIIVNSRTDQCSEAPIFDNGAALMSNYDRFPLENSIEENLEKVYGQPFSSSLEIQAKAMGIGIKIDYSKLGALLEKEPNSRALEVLKYQLERYKKILS